MSTPNEPKQWTETKKSVPAAALCFNVGAFEFAEKKLDGKSVPVKLVGRTGKPIAHWYWGNVVHDLAGMQLHKDRLPIDYCHYPDEVIGYLDKFETKSGDLVASGALVPFKEGDRAAEVIFKSEQKVPYEASINFGGGPLRLEEIETGVSVVVNGNLVNGPALIIRQWTLRGIAVCPYGADMNTRTELSDGKGNSQSAAAMVEVTLFKAGEMSKQNEAGATNVTSTEAGKPAAGATELAKPAEGVKPAEGEATNLAEGEKPAAKAEPKPEPKPGAEFITAFGDVGARWYLEGRTFSDCATEHAGKQQTRITELETEVANLKQQLAELPRGNDPVSFKSGPKADAKPLPKGVNGGAAAVMASAMSARSEAK